MTRVRIHTVVVPHGGIKLAESGSTVGTVLAAGEAVVHALKTAKRQSKEYGMAVDFVEIQIEVRYKKRKQK